MFRKYINLPSGGNKVFLFHAETFLASEKHNLLLKPFFLVAELHWETLFAKKVFLKKMGTFHSPIEPTGQPEQCRPLSKVDLFSRIVYSHWCRE